MFGLTGAQANHGEDVKEYWWYLDAVPSHAWNRWRYHYPQAAFPYDDLLAEQRPAGQARPGVRAARHRRVRRRPVLDRRGRLRQGRPHRPAHGGPGDQRRAPTPPRCTCSRPCGSATPGPGRRTRPGRGCGVASGGTVAIDHPFLGDLELLAGAGPDGVAPTALFCENETNDQRLYGVPGSTPYPKDGINDHVVHGAATVNPDRHGTKAALWYQLEVGPAATVELRLRLRPDGAAPARPRRRSAPTSTGSWPSAGRRPTSSTPS